jgi:phosphinothricin acetyltransferase
LSGFYYNRFVQIRTAAAQDLPAIQSIYAHHVLNGLASFEEVAPSLEEMRRRYEDITKQGFPYLVAEEKGEILGYGYCSLYRTRSAYRHTLEDSIYVKQGQQGKGVGKAVLTELIARCTALNYRQIIAVIGDSANAGSIKLHASLGFVRAGLLRSTGYKFGRWVDSVYMQLPLGTGDGTKP